MRLKGVSCGVTRLVVLCRRFLPTEGWTTIYSVNALSRVSSEFVTWRIDFHPGPWRTLNRFCLDAGWRRSIPCELYTLYCLGRSSAPPCKRPTLDMGRCDILYFLAGKISLLPDKRDPCPPPWRRNGFLIPCPRRLTGKMALPKLRKTPPCQRSVQKPRVIFPVYASGTSAA